MRSLSYFSARWDSGGRSNRPADLRFEEANPNGRADQSQAAGAVRWFHRAVTKPATSRLRPAQASRQPSRIPVFGASAPPSRGTDLGFAGTSCLGIAEQGTRTLTKPEQDVADESASRSAIAMITCANPLIWFTLNSQPWDRQIAGLKRSTEKNESLPFHHFSRLDSPGSVGMSPRGAGRRSGCSNGGPAISGFQHISQRRIDR
jgi:hypothetical protein